MRYKNETKNKRNGVVYTPDNLANYLSNEILEYADIDSKNSINILDPACGEGSLLISLVEIIKKQNKKINVNIYGFDTDKKICEKTKCILNDKFPDCKTNIVCGDFLEKINSLNVKFDIIIANPPYIRTQMLDEKTIEKITNELKIDGRVDIYYAFLLYVKKVLSKNGIAGFITSNKLFTIKSARLVRSEILKNYNIIKLIDFGDTKLFQASVLPCIMIFRLGTTELCGGANFTSIYETKEKASLKVKSLFDVINDEGIYELDNGKSYKIQIGTMNLSDNIDLWTLAYKAKNEWLDKVSTNTAMTFSNIGKVKVGIKSTADKVFIGNKWHEKGLNLELLKPLITHRNAGQIVPSNDSDWEVLYTHQVINGKRVAIDIDKYPLTKKYLLNNYKELSSRTYIKKSNRQWYEIWVPHDPDSWSKRKIVFRDITEKPQFWLDVTGAVVNGDCYWIDINDDVTDDVIYLVLAVANSDFIEKYYDYKFNTKLYSGKRRFMSQYVEQFPIPNPNTNTSYMIVNIVKNIINEKDCSSRNKLLSECSKLVEKAFTA